MPPPTNNNIFRHKLSMQILWMGFVLDLLVLTIAATGGLSSDFKEMAFIILPVFNSGGLVVVIQYFLGSSQRHDSQQNPEPPRPPQAQ